jgi:hypothetical protein
VGDIERTTRILEQTASSALERAQTMEQQGQYNINKSPFGSELMQQNVPTPQEHNIMVEEMIQGLGGSGDDVSGLHVPYQEPNEDGDGLGYPVATRDGGSAETRRYRFAPKSKASNMMNQDNTNDEIVVSIAPRT